jgi:hypothetical protein
MSKHEKQPNGHDHRVPSHDHATRKKMIHHDWRFWVGIVLMLLAMVAYVLSFDESLQPGGVENPEVPAAAE